MIGRGTWGVGAWVIAGALSLASTTIAPVVDSAPPAVVRRPAPFSAVLRPYPADSLARLVVARPVFRSSRRPAAVPYDPQQAIRPAESHRPPKPTLALLGLVAGAKPTAVIEGFPGVEGARVVRLGDEVSGVRVVRIGTDHVRLVGMDTVWVLRVREPWK